MGGRCRWRSISPRRSRTDFTGAAAWDRGDQGFFLGDLLSREKDTQLVALDPYQRGRIPVVFVHGTASSSARWADLFNELNNDRRIRERFQFWFFTYDTGNPVPYSARLLREALRNTVARLDPSGGDSSLRDMVLIGHSQGRPPRQVDGGGSGDGFLGRVQQQAAR